MITINELTYFLDLAPDQWPSYLTGKQKADDLREFLLKKYQHPTKIITMAALKGGIGKTFLSTHTAIRLSMLGFSVLLVDLDPEACASNSLLTEDLWPSSKKKTIYEVLKQGEDIAAAIIPTKYPGLDILPSSLRVSKAEKIVNGKNPKSLLKKYFVDLPHHFIFLELPPSFSTLSSAAYLCSDMIILPCTPNIHSLESVDLTIEAVKEVAAEFECPELNFKVLMNMFNPKRNASQDVLHILQDDYPDILYPFQIHESADVLNAINAGLSVFETRCSPLVRKELDQLAKNLLQAEFSREISPPRDIFPMEASFPSPPNH